jgi:hypothetical protein
MEITAHRSSQLFGTINASGTATQVLRIDDFTLIGLQATTSMTAGTLTFSAGYVDGTLGTVRTGTGATLSIGALSGTWSLSADELSFLAPYRYVRIFTSSAQTNGLQLVVNLKA